MALPQHAQMLRCCAQLSLALLLGGLNSPVQAQAWRNCVPGSIAPGGCDSIGPGGGMSIGPGGGQSIGPGGGLSIGPGGGQSIGPGGGQSIGPGGGQSLDRDRGRGLNPDTMRPYPDASGRLPDQSANPPPILLGQAIRSGASREEVLQTLGAPQRRETKGTREAWHFCRTGTSVDQFAAVVFESGKAIGTRNYQVTAQEAGSTGECSKFARSVLP
jgi:hypothetical protein